MTNPVGITIALVLQIYLGFLIVRFVVDWIQVFARSWSPRGPVLVVLEGVYSATDPPIHAFRKVFKPVRIGGAALDFSFMVVFLICILLLYVNGLIFR
ncbi:MAG: hypothetical protein JWO56_48 [Acidobacteria bacterium]|nr:hypothetical protein [Acidobacteriota bacterium]